MAALTDVDAERDVVLAPDPRISTTPPAWISRPDWRDVLCTMTDDDLSWITDQWERAGGPAHDVSWIGTELLGGGGLGRWPLVVVLALLALMVGTIVYEVRL